MKETPSGMVQVHEVVEVKVAVVSPEVVEVVGAQASALANSVELKVENVENKRNIPVKNAVLGLNLESKLWFLTNPKVLDFT
jgi:hypothetical protein